MESGPDLLGLIIAAAIGVPMGMFVWAKLAKIASGADRDDRR